MPYRRGARRWRIRPRRARRVVGRHGARAARGGRARRLRSACRRRQWHRRRLLGHRHHGAQPFGRGVLWRRPHRNRYVAVRRRARQCAGRRACRCVRCRGSPARGSRRQAGGEHHADVWRLEAARVPGQLGRWQAQSGCIQAQREDDGMKRQRHQQCRSKRDLGAAHTAPEARLLTFAPAGPAWRAGRVRQIRAPRASRTSMWPLRVLASRFRLLTIMAGGPKRHSQAKAREYRALGPRHTRIATPCTVVSVRSVTMTSSRLNIRAASMADNPGSVRGHALKWVRHRVRRQRRGWRPAAGRKNSLLKRCINADSPVVDCRCAAAACLSERQNIRWVPR